VLVLLTDPKKLPPSAFSKKGRSATAGVDVVEEVTVAFSEEDFKPLILNSSAMEN